MNLLRTMLNCLRFLALGLLLSLLSCTPSLSKKHLLVIGDSNGAGKGWVYALQETRGGGPLVNTALGGNTVGFNWQNKLEYNSLENLTSYLRKGYAEMGKIDEVLISLGTNDCKVEFADRHPEIILNTATLVTRTRAFFTERGQKVPRIVLISPPPAGQDTAVSDEFQGVSACVYQLTDQLRELATKEGLCFVDLQQNPGAQALAFSDDGIHFSSGGYELMAGAILKECY